MISALYKGESTGKGTGISQNEYLECNRLVFDLYSNEENSSLAGKIQAEFREFIVRELLPKLRQYQHNDLIVLKELHNAWSSYGLFKKWVSRLFHHHNKKIALYKQSDGKNEHTDYLAVAEFRNSVYTELKKRVLASIISVWSKARAHEDRDANLALLNSILSLLEEILDDKSVERKEFFERASEVMLKTSEEFYSGKLKEWNTDDCGSYFDWLDKFASEEEEILQSISKNSEELVHICTAIRKMLAEIFLQAYKKTLTSSHFGLSHLLSTKNFAVHMWITQALKKIKKLYTNYKDDFSGIYEAFKSHITGIINERFTEYVKMINEETDEKQQRKLKVVLPGDLFRDRDLLPN